MAESLPTPKSYYRIKGGADDSWIEVVGGGFQAGDRVEYEICCVKPSAISTPAIWTAPRDTLTIIDDMTPFAAFVQSAGAPDVVVSEQTANAVIGSSDLSIVANTIIGANQTKTLTKNKTINISERGIWVVVDVVQPRPDQQMPLVIYMAPGTGLTGTGRVSVNLAVSNFVAGLTSIYLNRDSFSTLDGTPDYDSDFLSYRLYFLGQEANPYSETICGILGALPQQNRSRLPRIALTNDDGFSSAYTVGHQYAISKGIRTTQFLIASTVGTSNCITEENIADMVSDGSYMGMHGIDSWSTLDNIDADHAALTSLGYSDCLHAAYPMGRIGDGSFYQSVRARLASLGVKSARRTHPVKSIFHPAYQDPYFIKATSLSNAVSLVQAKNAVDLAIESGGSLCFYGHKYGTTADSITWAIADYQSLVDYIAQKRDEGLVVPCTVPELYEEFDPRFC